MEFKLEIWKIKDLVALYKTKSLDLNPTYQRNAIWSLQAQRLLIDTVKLGLPLPAFFLQKKAGDRYEMVDGQQRTRAILAYLAKDGFSDKNGKKYVDGEFDNYEIAVNILNSSLPVEAVIDYYVRVNRSGLRLERPELNKAEYFDTKFLSVVTELTDDPAFKNLGIFKNAQIRRMFDRDFVEELVVQLLYGITDKKLAVDQTYRADLTDDQVKKVSLEFPRVLETVQLMNRTEPLENTRFSQKNDFYTLFGLVLIMKKLKKSEIAAIFKTLVKVSEGISPSNSKCPPLQEYAFNCVTQSNSKKARERRLEILKELILNEGPNLNQTQKTVCGFMGASTAAQKQVGPYVIPSIV